MTTSQQPLPSNSAPQSEGALSKLSVESNSSKPADGEAFPLQYRGVQYGALTSSRSTIQWFYNLPVRRKHLIALFASEVISVLGLVGVSSALIVLGGRAQLANQAASEAAVTEMAYNIKVNGMGFGFRGQSDNPAIINAAINHNAGVALSRDEKNQLRELLRNELRSRQIEYATLVGKDMRVIANANADRAGKPFDPVGLVTKVFSNPQQLKASALVSRSELETESVPGAKELDGQNVLIRYVVTPVRNPRTNEVIGALVSGDIAKRSIVEDTLAALDNGYSAVYFRQPGGNFELATSLKLGDQTDLSRAQSNVPLPDTSLLQQASNNLKPGMRAGEPVTQRLTLDGHEYTVAAEALPDASGKPIAVLVRGTSETGLNQLLMRILLLQLGIATITIIADILLSGLLSRAIVRPLKKLQEAARQFAEGERSVRAEVFAVDEVGELSAAFNELADDVTASEQNLVEQYRRQQEAAKRAQLMTEITVRIRRSLDIDEILKTSVDGVRQLLQVDRVLIYRFNSDFKSGMITAESVGDGWLRAFGQTIYDPLTPATLERYRAGRISTMENLATAALSRCHCEILERLEVQANMVAPIIAGEDLIGILCAHQCSGPRQWTTEETELMQQLATQIGYGLSQAMVLQQQSLSATRERQLNGIVSKMRESLDQTTIQQTVVTEARAALAVDRVIVYLFDQNWAGKVVAESVDSQYPIALGANIADPCFADGYVEKYRQGRVQATENIFEANLTECHLKQLKPFEVKANLVAPILVGGKLKGLLVAHQCSGPRAWKDLDITFFKQIAIQFGFALEQAELFSQREKARLETEALSEERQQQKEALQMQLLTLLSEVEGATRGDLTVRADVTAGDIGTVADFFNSIVESLRQIVTKVKQSANQVNASLGQNEGAMRHLAEEALRQAEETTRTLDSIEQMTYSIRAVADSAQQAAEIARNASLTAEVGGSAIDRTVQNILSLRETVGETAKRVKRLGEASQQISKVVSLINQIAMQTNLLAINAGIEAARAGEEGQGFAVVAEEVGELAARSASATQEIEKIVENIQRETSQVVEAMEQSTAQVVEGTHLVEDAKQSLNQILEVSRQIDELVQSISDATISQVQTSETVSRLMKEIAQVSERTSSSSRQVSTALRQTVEVAQELQESVETFKVGAEV